jgi:hypothetical protein
LVYAQKKQKIKTIGYSLTYNNKIYEGFYNGSTVKSKVDSKKMDLPNSNGFFQGYVENSGKKSVVFVDQYKDILALRGTSWWFLGRAGVKPARKRFPKLPSCIQNGKAKG